MFLSSPSAFTDIEKANVFIIQCKLKIWISILNMVMITFDINERKKWTGINAITWNLTKPQRNDPREVPYHSIPCRSLAAMMQILINYFPKLLFRFLNFSSQSCSNYLNRLKNMATRVGGSFFYINILKTCMRAHVLCHVTCQTKKNNLFKVILRWGSQGLKGPLVPFVTTC